VTEQWCQAVRELYELQQNSASERRGNFIQSSIENAITYGSIKDDVPNKYDKQSFLHSTGNGSQHSGSPTRITQQTTQSPVGMYTDVLQTPQSTYQIGESATKPQLLYPPTAEITPEARRKAEEERAVLEAMTQYVPPPVSPYLGPLGLPGWLNTTPSIMQDPADGSFQFGTYVPLGYGRMQMDGENGGGLAMEDFPSLDEIISSMEGIEGMNQSGVDGGFWFLDDWGLFDMPL
jgi:hypothetical protein